MDSQHSPPVESAETHPDRLIDFWEWLVENRKQVILAIFIAVVVVLIVYINRQNTKFAEEAASEDVLAAMDPRRFSSDQVNPKSTPSERFAEVVVNHPDTAGARNAKFLQASALFDEGGFKKADAVFADYISENPLSPLRAAAALGQAACKASLNNGPGAEAAYEAIRNQYADTSEAVQATLALGRLAMAAEDTAKAEKLFTDVSENKVSPFWASVANELLGQHGQ